MSGSPATVTCQFRWLRIIISRQTEAPNYQKSAFPTPRYRKLLQFALGVEKYNNH